MLILNGNSIDRSTIGTHAKATVSFWHKNDQYGARTQTFTHMSMIYEMLALCISLVSSGLSRYGALLGRGVPGMRSIRCRFHVEEEDREVAHSERHR